jgi:hypothetical protein
MTTTKLFTTLLLAGSVLAACGGDDDSDDAAATEPSSESAAVDASETSPTTLASPVVTEAPSAATVAPAATDAATTAAPAATDAPATAAPASGRFTDCPDAADLAPLYGSELQLEEDQAMTGAVGLVFCPYVEVLAPGTTNAFGGEKIPDEFSITFTDQNIVIPGEGEEVPGLGESAAWSGGDLAVWTGEQGIIVSIVFDTPAGDAKTVSIAIAQEILA